ncbi:hypothetical protein VMCG_05214 [Cytospora schulzeri]|uniref:Rhodopsin domain-containing protein n=1 Tax=Cytospora schulzeri TaxID=448051 RepID=A0A423WR56_9PEZI|nr:hypothetical protein VMCG_05214 [Valsa malicola]
MAEKIDRSLLQARWEDVSDIPATQFQQSMLAVIYFIAVIALITYCLRMYSKISSKQIGLEDWLITAAMVLSIAFMPVTYYYFKYSYAGFPTSRIPKAYDPTPALFWTWIVGLLYNPILALVKSSVLVFMQRIAGHKTEVMWAIYVINTINVCLMVAVFLVVIFQTTPIAAYWDKSLTVKHSINAAAFGMSTFIFTIVTDVLVLAIPIYTFIGLKVNIATKVGVIMIFLTGGFVTIIGILRVIGFANFFWTSDYDFTNSWGPSYSSIEPNLAIIAACTPSLRPLLRKWFPRIFSQSSSKQTGRYQKQQDYGNPRSGQTRSIHLNDLGQTRAAVQSGISRGDSQDEILASTGIIKTAMVNVS